MTLDKNLNKKKEKGGLPRKGPGRPPGSKNRKTLIEAAIQTSLVNRLEKDAEKIYKKAVELALEGDKTMIKMFMDRLIPELKLTGEEGKTSSGGIQIVVNGYSDNKEKTINEPITINQITHSNEDDNDA